MACLLCKRTRVCRADFGRFFVVAVACDAVRVWGAAAVTFSQQDDHRRSAGVFQQLFGLAHIRSHRPVPLSRCKRESGAGDVARAGQSDGRAEGQEGVRRLRLAVRALSRRSHWITR